MSTAASAQITRQGKGEEGNKGRVLIDTCGWVDFLRSGSGMLGDQVERAMVEDRACLCGVSVAELLQGVRGQKEKRQLEMLFVLTVDKHFAHLGVMVVR